MIVYQKTTSVADHVDKSILVSFSFDGTLFSCVRATQFRWYRTRSLRMAILRDLTDLDNSKRAAT